MKTIIVFLALSTAAAAQVTVSGTVNYQDRTYDGGGFTGTALRPVRQAEIELIRNSDNAILGTGVTDNAGGFSFNLPADGIVRLRIYARRTGGQIRAEIRNNPGTNQLYAALSSTHDTTSGTPFDINLTIAGGAAPAFNLFDCAVMNFQLLAQLEPTLPAVPPLLRIYWQAGSTNGTYFDRTVNGIFLLGHASDPDEFDDDIVHHEIGHWVSFHFSKDDSLGGPHTIIDQLDPRTSWSEGFAHFWSSLVRRFAAYPFPTLQVDNFGTGHSTFDLEGPSLPAQAIMATNELAVGCVLWDIVDTANEGAFDTVSGQEAEVWRALSVRIPSRSNITLEDFHAGLTIEAPGIMAAVTGTDALPGIFKDRRIRYYVDGSEPNGSSGTAATLAPGLAGLPFRTFDTASDEDWFSVTVAPGTLIVETRNLGDGGNTVLELFDASGTVLLGSNDNRSPSDLSSQVSRVVPTGGTFLLRVTRTGLVVERGYYDVRAQLVGNAPPTINSVSASATQGSAPLRITLTADITDVDGGSHEFLWDFNGDGIVDWASFEGPTVTTTYQESGTYSALLRVVDSGDSTITAPITIIVHPFTPASAIFSGIADGTAPHTVNFNATVLGVTPVALLWDVDADGIYDSASATSAALTFTYRSPGTFSPRLLVRDDQGRAMRTLVPSVITVSAGASPPTVGPFTASSGVVPYASSMVVTHSNLGPSGVVDFDVDGDGRFDFRVPAGSPTGTTFLPAIQRAGTFTPAVRVTDSAGLSAAATAAYTARTVGLAGWMVDPLDGDRVEGSAVTLTAQAVPRSVSKSVQFQVRESTGPGPWTNVGGPIVSTGTLFSTSWDVTAIAPLSSFNVRILVDGTASSGDTANTVIIDPAAATISEDGASRSKMIRTDRTTVSRSAAGVWAIVPLGSTPDGLPLGFEPASVPAANGSAAGKVPYGTGVTVTFAGTFTNSWRLRLPYTGGDVEIHRFDAALGRWDQFAPSRIGGDGWVESDVVAPGVYALFGPVPPRKKKSGGCGATGLEALVLLLLLRRRRS